MLLALWPLFISTGVALPQQDISQLVTQYNESKYERAIKREVSLSASTSQVQSLSAKFNLVAAPHNVFLFANTGQQQEVNGRIGISSLDSLSEFAKLTLASTYYRLNVATAQSQSISGAISTSNFSSPILADNSNSTVKDYLAVADEPIQVADKYIGLYASSVQNQHIVGNITLSEFTPISDAEVSAHSLANVSTAQAQEISGKISVTVISHVAISAAISEQRQGISGRITTNDDEEMLMVLLALLELDDVA